MSVFARAKARLKASTSAGGMSAALPVITIPAQDKQEATDGNATATR